MSGLVRLEMIEAIAAICPWRRAERVIEEGKGREGRFSVGRCRGVRRIGGEQKVKTMNNSPNG